MGSRFLLPFVEDIDLEALNKAARFARKHRAVLTPLALLPLSEQQWAEGPRLELIEQANDFLEAIRCQAAQVRVAIEPCAIETRDAARSIQIFAQEMMCDKILLFIRESRTVLLPRPIAQQVLDEVTSSLCLFRLEERPGMKLVQKLMHWMSNLLYPEAEEHQTLPGTTENRLRSLTHVDHAPHEQ
ncbi:hypothetical protein KSD_79700 [Ktedonobacter sp. SOSP1-85]|uniref:universal stress protein n=1 Tax=Ktedonobacter sp. SOSP1-85 TaxID=2778367 RepID=UPI001916BC9D|nr:universal stress protein [Ktedonobacter sp. SOSP1-85]GHO80199.1 hypothetical protein KSD_79700 [Ktedonobacter sp. SOSP1-85]